MLGCFPRLLMFRRVVLVGLLRWGIVRRWIIRLRRRLRGFLTLPIVSLPLFPALIGVAINIALLIHINVVVVERLVFRGRLGRGGGRRVRRGGSWRGNAAR